MSEIKVVPYIPDEDYDNPAMVVDFYEFTMANCLFLNGFKDTTLVFDMFFRKNPDNQGYSISAGQRKLTRFLLNYHFNEQDVHWLRTKGMSEEFCEYLRTYRWKGDMYALPEGTVCYPHVQMVRIECDLVGAILIETYLLQTMNFHSLIATKATRITGLNTHTPRSVMEFGTRRAQGESAGNDGAYAAVLGGCIGTANCLAEMKYGSEVKAVGTVAHSFIEFFPTEFDAFKAFADTYPDSVSLLLDTYNIMESGLPNLIKLDDYLIEKYPDDPNRRVKSAPSIPVTWPEAPSACARHWMQQGSPTSSWWPPTVWTRRRSPTWSCTSTHTSTPTAWARTSSPRPRTLCLAACTSWWRSNAPTAAISPR